ncbi:MAG: hypothetical protein AAF420_06950 [Pseudomonadota bacterium]
MPIITVRSLPMPTSFDASAVAVELSRRFAQKMRIEIQNISVYWESNPTCYVVGGESADQQSNHSHPLLVTLLAPDYNDEVTIERMLIIIAKELADLTGIDHHNIFVHFQGAPSRGVFDAGRVIDWENTAQRGLGRRGNRTPGQ